MQKISKPESVLQCLLPKTVHSSLRHVSSSECQSGITSARKHGGGGGTAGQWLSLCCQFPQHALGRAWIYRSLRALVIITIYSLSVTLSGIMLPNVLVRTVQTSKVAKKIMKRIFPITLTTRGTLEGISL